MAEHRLSVLKKSNQQLPRSLFSCRSGSSVTSITDMLSRNSCIAQIMASNLFSDRYKAARKTDIKSPDRSVIVKKRLKRAKPKEQPMLFQSIVYKYSCFQNRKIDVFGWRPSSREGGAMHYYQGGFYLFGGICNQPFSEYAVLRNGKWQKLSIKAEYLLDLKAVGFASCRYKSQFYFFGGSAIQRRLGPFREALNLNLVYDAKTDSFSWFRRDYIESRVRHTVSMIDGKFLVLVGGFNSHNQFIQSVDYYDLKRNCWSAFDSLKLAVVAHSATTVRLDKAKLYSSSVKECILLFGGLVQNLKTTNRLQLLIINNDYSLSASELPASGMPPAPRLDHASTYSEQSNSVIVTGGRNFEGRVFGDVFAFNIPSSEWTLIKLEGWPFKPRYGHCCVSVQGSIFLFGGLNAESLMEAQMFVLSRR